MSSATFLGERPKVMAKTEFPKSYLGTLDARGQHLPVQAMLSVDLHAAPEGLTAHGVVLVWAIVDSFGDVYTVWADYKGRGFSVVDPRACKDITGPVFMDWQDPVIVWAVTIGAAQAYKKARAKR